MTTSAKYGKDEFNHSCIKISSCSDSYVVQCKHCGATSNTPKLLVSQGTSDPQFTATLHCCSVNVNKGATEPSNMSKK